MSRNLKITCNVCGSEAIVTKTMHDHQDLKRLYCTCKNKECNHKFVINLEFSHTTRHSDLIMNPILLDMIDKLPKNKKEELIKSLKE